MWDLSHRAAMPCKTTQDFCQVSLLCPRVVDRSSTIPNIGSFFGPIILAILPLVHTKYLCYNNSILKQSFLSVGKF